MNIETFSIFVILIFDELYDNFPISMRIRAEDLINRAQKFESIGKDVQQMESKKRSQNVERELALAHKKVMSGENVNPELIESEAKRIPLTEEEQANNLALAELKEKQQNIRAVFEGTKEFLINEHFIVGDNTNGFRLTAKGFSHLNFEFRDKAIINKDAGESQAEEQSKTKGIEKVRKALSDLVKEGVKQSIVDAVSGVITNPLILSNLGQFTG